MISIREVAKLAGVSPATVSRVMNGTAKVTEEKRKRVLSVIEDTGFSPNELARALYKQSLKIIGVIVPTIENPFFNHIAKAIEEEAFQNGYRIILCNSNGDSEKEIMNIQMLSRMKADGMILMVNKEELRAEISQCQFPVIVLDRRVVDGTETAVIEADHYEGGKMATKHLLDCDCKQIVAMVGVQELSSARQRFQGYVDICKEYNLPVQSIVCDYDYNTGLLQTEELLKQYPDVDGIIASNDMVAISVYKVLRKKGYDIPKDIQVVGFDNVELSWLVTPELTTIAQPIEEMGKLAIHLILSYIRGEKIEKEYKLPVCLIERETTRRKSI